MPTMTRKDKYFFWIGLIFYTCIRLLWNDVAPDDSGRLSGALSLLLDKGYNSFWFDIDSLKIYAVSLAPKWPALTCYSIAFLSKFTGNVYMSYFILEIASIILFLWSFFKLLTLHSDNMWIRYFFLFFCVGAIFTLKVVSIDLHCLSISTYTLYLLAKQSDLTKKNASFWLIISSLLSITCLIRFNFYAVALIPAITLGAYWLITKSPKYLKFAFISSVIPLLTIALQTIFIKTQSTDIAFIQDFKFSIFWKNIFYARPVITTLLLDIDTNFLHKYLLDHHPNLPYNTIVNSTNMVILLIEFTGIAWVFYKLKAKIKVDLFHLYICILVIILFASIYALSIYMQPLAITPYRQWTFASEARYFSLALVALIIMIVYNFNELTNLSLNKLLKISFFLLLVPTLAIHLYRGASRRYTTNFTAYSVSSLKYSPPSEADYYLTDNLAAGHAFATRGKQAVTYQNKAELLSALAKIKKMEGDRHQICILSIDHILNISELNAIVDDQRSNFEIFIN